MIAEAIDRIQQLTRLNQSLPLTEAVTETFDGNSVTYLRKVAITPDGRELGDRVAPPRPEILKVSTLTGLMDAIVNGAAGDMKGRIVHVEDYLNVAVKSIRYDQFGVRDTVLRATYKPMDAFQFGQFYDDPSKFIIALQAAFYMNDDAVYLQRVASGLAAVHGAVSTSDDGMAQTVVVKQGEVRTAETTLKPRLKLIPRRTFDEAAPVESEFLVRLKAQSTPSIALFSIDGTKWQGECMQSIARYLAAHLPEGTPVIA